MGSAAICTLSFCLYFQVALIHFEIPQMVTPSLFSPRTTMVILHMAHLFCREHDSNLYISKKIYLFPVSSQTNMVNLSNTEGNLNCFTHSSRIICHSFLSIIIYQENNLDSISEKINTKLVSEKKCGFRKQDKLIVGFNIYQIML